MPIKLNIMLSAAGRLKPVSSLTLHDRRITVGRDKECTLTLEDTQKHVSRMHAEIEHDADCYWIKVVSKVNPIAVNGKRFSYGERAPLVEGDQVNIGLYKIEVVEAEVPQSPKKAAPLAATDISEETTFAPVPEPAPAPAPPVSPPPSVPPPPSPVTRSAPPVTVPDSAPEEIEATYVPPRTKAPVPAAPKPPPARPALPESAISDDEVTYIPPVWAKRTGAAGPGPAGDTTVDDLTHIGRSPIEKPPSGPEPVPQSAPAPKVPPAPAEATPAMELDFDLSDAFETPAAAPTPAHVPAASSPPAAPKIALRPESEVEEDFSEDLTYVRRPPPRPASMAPAAPPARPVAPAGTDEDRLSEEETQFRSPVPAGTMAPTVPLPPAAGAPAVNADRSVQAFLEGAGLTNIKVTDPGGFLRDSGVMVRAAVEGIMMLLLARDEARRQLGAEPDAGVNDNPIKSMASPAEVLAFLFDPKRPAIGDTDPVQAFSEACSELRSHQVALFEGMRAAVASALQRIDPKAIEREHGTHLGMLNITRKSKLWDLSVAQHEQLAREMEEDFGKVFGEAILSAYNAQVRKARGG